MVCIKATFKNCSQLTEIKFNENITNVSGSMFYGCTSLKNVTFAVEPEKIGDYAFYNCSSLENINIGNKVTEISSYTFYGCTSLKEMSVPATVTSVGPNAFENCTGLNFAAFYGTNTVMYSSAFTGCKDVALYCYRNSNTHRYIAQLSNIDDNSIAYINDDFYVTNLDVTGMTSKTVTLSWEKPKDVTQKTRYNVYRNGEKVASAISKTTFTESGLTSGEEYNYEVSAIDLSGVESAVKVSITAVPACSTVKYITEPGGTVGGTVPVALKASMVDGFSYMDSKGEFFYAGADGEFVKICDAQMNKNHIDYTGEWDLTDLKSGEYTLRFVFTDKDGGCLI